MTSHALIVIGSIVCTIGTWASIALMLNGGPYFFLALGVQILGGAVIVKGLARRWKARRPSYENEARH